MDVAATSMDLSQPISTQKIEGAYTKTTSSFIAGTETDLETGDVTGVNFGSTGGGVYDGRTTVLTIEDMFSRLAEEFLQEYESMKRNALY